MVSKLVALIPPERETTVFTIVWEIEANTLDLGKSIAALMKMAGALLYSKHFIYVTLLLLRTLRMSSIVKNLKRW